MPTHAKGARTARTSARTNASPGRRGRPFTRKASNSYPAAGTRRASIRSGDPAKLTLTPRAVSASATAIAGRTCPAVPPAAMRHLSDCFDRMVLRDVKEDADGGERDDQARAAVRDERKRNARQRRDAHHRTEVDGRLTADERGEAGREALPERIAAAERDVDSRVAERDECQDHGDGAEEAELLADDRKDHVRRRLREVVDLLHALAEPDPEDAAGPERDHRLHRLEAGALRIAPRVEEREEPCPAIRLQPDRQRKIESPIEPLPARTRSGVPATTSIAPTITVSAIAVPRSGSARSRAPVNATTSPIGRRSSPTDRGVPRRTSVAASHIATASFASSDGWKPNAPSGSHRRAPFTVVPITRTATSSTRLVTSSGPPARRRAW